MLGIEFDLRRMLIIVLVLDYLGSCTWTKIEAAVVLYEKK